MIKCDFMNVQNIPIFFFTTNFPQTLNFLYFHLPQTRERLIQNLKNDLEKSRKRLQDMETKQARAEATREKERLQT